MQAAQLRYEEIKIGSSYAFERIISQKDGQVFAQLSGDFNPLHTNEDFGAKSQFGCNIVHGMFAASLFSTLIGMYCPGECALYMSQTLHFRKPLFYGSSVVVRGTVVEKNDSIRMITMKTEIWQDSEMTVSGEAKVKIL